jgi:Type III pantothenate kinase
MDTSRPMLLAIDAGNTQTVLGLYDGEALRDHWRVATERRTTADELGVLLGGFLDFDGIDGIVLASTVPALVREYEAFADRWAGARFLVVGPGISTGIPIRYDDPREVGPDRIANAVAARERYGAPCIVVDFGTSTNFDVVSAEGEYVGGVLAPGIEISMDALFARAARLFRDDASRSPVGSGLRLRRPGGRDRRADPRRARGRGASNRHRWARRGRRSARGDARLDRPVPHARRPPPDLGAESGDSPLTGTVPLRPTEPVAPASRGATRRRRGGSATPRDRPAVRRAASSPRRRRR